MKISIILVEDHELVRQGVEALLAGSRNLTVVGSCGDGLQAVELVKRLKPDVLIVDLSLPGIDGLEVTYRIHERYPETRVIILSMHENEEYILDALKKGAMGYVLKESSSSDLIEAIQRVVRGKHFLSKSIPEEILFRFKEKRQKSLSRYDTLSAREREVLTLVAEGKTSTEIAEQLFLSTRTVETHRSNLMAKLGLRTQTDLVHFALQRGLVQAKPRFRDETD